MPLMKSTKRTKYLNNYLESGDVSDVIEWGKDKYPVDALCSDHRFVDALNFVRRGYRMMHDGCFVKEFYNILYSLEVESRILSSGQNSRTAKEQLKQCLIDEFEQFHDYEPYILGEEFAFRLHDDTERYMKLINSVRKDFPLVYSELLKCNTMSDYFIPILLLCNDMTLARDFAKGIVKPEVYKESVSEFGDGFNRGCLCSDATEMELTRGLDVFRIFEFADDNTWQALSIIMRYQPALLPHELYWKLAVLITVRRMRELVDAGDTLLEGAECVKWDEDTVGKLCPAAENILEDMELMLRTYIPKINAFNLFAGEGGIMQALINLCGYHNLEMDSEDFTFDSWESPHECDLMVLKRAVTAYCKGNELMLHDYMIAASDNIRGFVKKWRDWYSRMDPEHSEPNVDDFYKDKYQMFLKYADLFSDYDRSWEDDASSAGNETGYRVIG
ncbi:MAG: hypothetical protein IJ661_05795 [Lachnospiraceae bacterium]|nr:hypothetical protein [Lachnospiraceae bacterium]